MDKGQDANRTSFMQGIKALAEISIVLGSALFLLGWSYLYGYYRAFGLSASELGFPLQSVFMFALPVIRTRWFVIAFAVLAVLLFVGSWLRVIDRSVGHPVVILVVAVVAAVFASSYAAGVGRVNARRDSFTSTSTLPYVKLEGILPEANLGACTLNEWNYRLLFRTEKQIYVILPLDTADANSAANLRVCGFQEGQIRAVRIQVGLEDANGP